MKKVSIIVPVFNVCRYLPACLESIISQSYHDLEIILIDDGSTDGSSTICDEYAKNDSRIRVIHQNNAGAANAKNAGLDILTGKYVAFVDSDDYVAPDWIETLVNVAEANQADVVECAFDKVFSNRSKPVNPDIDTVKVFTAESYLEQYLFNWTCSLFWNKLFCASLINHVRFRRERRCIDDEFFTYKALSDASKIVQIPNILYHYRQRASSVVSSEINRKQITDDSLEILIERYNWIKSRFPRLTKVYLKHDIEIMFYFSREFIFRTDTVQKFRKTARFYFLQCILHFPGKVTLFYAIQLQHMSKKLMQNEIPNQQVNADQGLFP